MRYSDTVQIRPATIGAQVIDRDVPVRWVPRPMPHAPVWHRLGQAFDPAHFMAAHPPVQVGQVLGQDLDGIDEAAGPHGYLRTPIKQGGTTRVQIPTELRPILPVLEIGLETFAATYPDWCNAHVQITWEGGWVEPGTTQRIPGWHVDGYQGVRQARHPGEASILWSDAMPAEHCVQPFFVQHLDASRHNVHATLEQQARESSVLVGQAGGLYLVDPYCVHRGARAPARLWRNVVRLTVTSLPLTDPTNTRNLGFPGPQDHAPRIEVRDRLWTSTAPIPWETLGFAPVPSR